MDTSGRHQQLENKFCLYPEVPAARDNLELAVRAVITLHHKYAAGYPDKNGVKDGTILAFVPGKPEIQITGEKSMKQAISTTQVLGQSVDFVELFNPGNFKEQKATLIAGGTYDVKVNPAIDLTRAPVREQVRKDFEKEVPLIILGRWSTALHCVFTDAEY